MIGIKEVCKSHEEAKTLKEIIGDKEYDIIRIMVVFKDPESFVHTSELGSCYKKDDKLITATGEDFPLDNVYHEWEEFDYAGGTKNGLYVWDEGFLKQ